MIKDNIKMVFPTKNQDESQMLLNFRKDNKVQWLFWDVMPMGAETTLCLFVCDHYIILCTQEGQLQRWLWGGLRMTLVLPNTHWSSQIPRPRSGVHPPPNNGDKNLLMVNSQDYSLLLLGFWTVQRENVTLSEKEERSKAVFSTIFGWGNSARTKCFHSPC